MKNISFKLIPLSLVAVVLLSFILPADTARADPGWYNTDWPYRKKIIINSENVSGSSNIPNFPVMISLTSDSDLGSKAQLDGDDIFFTDSVGAKLSHEIESFSSNGATANLTAWIKITSLSYSADTDIYMYYGNGGAGNQESATSVWDNNYVFVDHMKDDPDTSHTKDSTSLGNDGTKKGAGEPAEVTAKVDEGQDFDGSDDYVSMGDVLDTYLSGDDIKFTLEAIIKVGASDLTGNTLLGKWDTVSDQRQLLWMLTTDSKIKLQWYRTGAAADWHAVLSTTQFTNTAVFYHVTYTYDGTIDTNGGLDRVGIYVNGEGESGSLASSGTLGGIYGSSSPLMVGTAKASTLPFDGIIDEARISNDIRDADWIKTSYNNQSNPADFYSVGSEQSAPSAPSVTTGPASFVEESTASINGTLTDDGGEACQYSFEWGTSTGTYTDNISWTGSINSGDNFSTALSSLTKGELYYYRARALNSAGIGNGSELTFLTKPEAPTSLTATTASSSQINLSWSKGEGAGRTMVRGKEGSYPDNIGDGYEVYFGTGTNASDTSLNPGTTYYYRAWSEVTEGSLTQYSDGFDAANATTTSGAPTVIGGLVLPVNKAVVLAPLIALGAVLLLAVFRLAWYIRGKRKSARRPATPHH